MSTLIIHVIRVICTCLIMSAWSGCCGTPDVSLALPEIAASDGVLVGIASKDGVFPIYKSYPMPSEIAEAALSAIDLKNELVLGGFSNKSGSCFAIRVGNKSSVDREISGVMFPDPSESMVLSSLENDKIIVVRCLPVKAWENQRHQGNAEILFSGRISEGVVFCDVDRVSKEYRVRRTNRDDNLDGILSKTTTANSWNLRVGNNSTIINSHICDVAATALFNSVGEEDSIQLRSFHGSRSDWICSRVGLDDEWIFASAKARRLQILKSSGYPKFVSDQVIMFGRDHRESNAAFGWDEKDIYLYDIDNGWRKRHPLSYQNFSVTAFSLAGNWACVTSGNTFPKNFCGMDQIKVFSLKDGSVESSTNMYATGIHSGCETFWLQR